MNEPRYMVYACPCKEMKHQLDMENINYRLLRKLIELEGMNIKVTVLGQDTYLVPRIYIAMHGLKAKELPSLAHKLGFGRVVSK